MERFATREKSGGPWLSKLNVFCLIVALFGAYCSWKTAAWDFGVDSDMSHSLMLWYGVQEGGLGWLKDWHFTPDNWLFSLVPLHFAAFSLLGPKLSIPIIGGWMIFVASALTSAAIAWSSGARKAAAPIMAILLNMGFYAHRDGFISNSTAHDITNLFGLLTLLCLILWCSRGNWLALFAAMALLISGSLSDPWMIAAFVLPIGIVGATMAAWPSFGQRARYLTLPAIAAMVIVAVYTKLFGYLFFVPKFDFAIANWVEINDKFPTIIKNLGGLLDIGPILDSYYIIIAVFSIFLIYTTYQLLIFHFVSSHFSLSTQNYLLYAIAGLSFLGTLGGLLIMKSPSVDVLARFLINAPYLVVITLGVLAESCWRTLSLAVRILCTLVPVAFVLSAAASTARFWLHHGLGVRDTEVAGEVAFLRANGLTYGYGAYWGTNANAVTAATRNQIRLRPIRFDPATGQAIFDTRAESSRRWYDKADAPAGTRQWFIIAKPDVEECPDVQLCLAGLKNQFGAPVRTLVKGDQTALVWDHPLTDQQSPILMLAGRKTLFAQAGAHLNWPGWSSAEPWGTWTDGDDALMELRLEKPAQSPVRISLQGHAFLADRRRVQRVEVLINNHAAGVLQFDLKHNEGVRVLTVPASAIRPDGLLVIRFAIKSPPSPLEAGLSKDARHLGLGLEAITVG